jgi:hypothetical protein
MSIAGSFWLAAHAGVDAGGEKGEHDNLMGFLLSKTILKNIIEMLLTILKE